MGISPCGVISHLPSLSLFLNLCLSFLGFYDLKKKELQCDQALLGGVFSSLSFSLFLSCTHTQLLIFKTHTYTDTQIGLRLMLKLLTPTISNIHPWICKTIRGGKKSPFVPLVDVSLSKFYILLSIYSSKCIICFVQMYNNYLYNNLIQKLFKYLDPPVARNLILKYIHIFCKDNQTIG